MINKFGAGLGLGLGSGGGSLLLPETRAYRDRVLADGGVIRDIKTLNNDIKFLRDNGLLTGDNAISWWYSTQHGVKFRGASTTFVERLYDFAGSLDISNTVNLVEDELPSLNPATNVLTFTAKSGRVTNLSRTVFGGANPPHPFAGMFTHTAELTLFMLSDNGNMQYGIGVYGNVTASPWNIRYGGYSASGTYNIHILNDNTVRLKTYRKIDGRPKSGAPIYVDAHEYREGIKTVLSVTLDAADSRDESLTMTSNIVLGGWGVTLMGTLKIKDWIVFNKPLSSEKQDALATYLVQRGI